MERPFLILAQILVLFFMEISLCTRKKFYCSFKKGTYLFLTQLPSYMKEVLKFDSNIIQTF